jgi:TRAP-type C4-dicarboxylate transport system permease small subunit
MKKAESIFKKIQQFIYNLDAAILLIIMCIILAQTVGRAFRLSIPWSEEASRYLFVIMILLGINVGISKNLMVRIDMIDNILSPRIKRAFNVAREIVALIVAFILFYSCFPLIRVGSFQKSPAMQLPMSALYTIVAIGFGLAVISVLFRLIHFIIGNKEEQK